MGVIILGSLYLKKNINYNKNNPKQIIAKSIIMQKVFFKTSDNIQITSNYLPIDRTKFGNPLGWIIFVHMMPATKESWAKLALKFQDLGYESLAIDLRGHGESQGGPNGFKTFSDIDHQKSNLDVEAAVGYLKTKGAKPEKIAFIGASIGANLALQYISNHPEFKISVLLSPGLDYRGIKTEQAAKELQSDQKVFLIGSKDDNSNYAEIKQIFNDLSGGVKKEMQIFDTGGHGTDILNNHPELKEVIVNFMKS